MRTPLGRDSRRIARRIGAVAANRPPNRREVAANWLVTGRDG